MQRRGAGDRAAAAGAGFFLLTPVHFQEMTGGSQGLVDSRRSRGGGGRRNCHRGKMVWLGRMLASEVERASCPVALPQMIQQSNTLFEMSRFLHAPTVGQNESGRRLGHSCGSRSLPEKTLHWKGINPAPTDHQVCHSAD